MSALQLLFVFAVAFTADAASLESYGVSCPKDDPQLDTCFANAVEKMRQHLIEGIPDLGVPAIDPLKLAEVKVDPLFGDWIKILLKNIKADGAGKFRTANLKVNLKDNEFRGEVHIPFLAFEGDYNVDATVLNLSLKGNGSVKGNTTENCSEFVLKGDLEKRDGGRYFNFKQLKIKLIVKQLKACVNGLINGELVIGDAVRDTTGHQLDLWKFIKETIEQTLSEVALEVINSVAKQINVDELFP
ncbi:uncharacterized protein LOC124596539 [Schistocerca americana]|uniref:uncharacterized protein LOC124596539 n=1 Tax=Schistocerca americana TaxID=7009 RepID=UPI001F4F5FF0|nr:uncharacterized protein LOC124596539 [Schistocerca americana]